MVVELYWLPGCSACLRMKEFVEATGVPYEAINVEAEPERMAKVLDSDLLLPAACVGGRCVNGLDLKAVAELLGLPYEQSSLLPPEALLDRERTVLAALVRHLRQMPPDGLEYCLEGRQRPMLAVANQAASVIRAFLVAYDTNMHDKHFYQLPATVRTADDLIARAAQSGEMLDEWWEREGRDDPLDRIVETFWGHRTLHEVFEREVWHSAHHTRQIGYVLERLGITPDVPLTASDLVGLPMPERVHD